MTPCFCLLAPVDSSFVSKQLSFQWCSYLEQREFSSHVLLTQVQLGLPEEDGQGPESQQGGYAQGTVDPERSALLGNLGAVQGQSGSEQAPLTSHFSPVLREMTRRPQSTGGIPALSLPWSSWASTFPQPPCPWAPGLLVPTVPSGAQRYPAVLAFTPHPFRLTSAGL